jgi:tetratricopeptide (TPR) repeat protein
LNEVIIIRPHYAAAYLNRGLARFELEDYASALRDYDQSIKFDPQNALAFNNRGIVKHKLEDYNSAIMDYDMAIKLEPEMASAYFNRAMAREILKRPGYENDYKIAAQLNPQFDLSNRRLDAEQMAQQQQNQKNQGNTQQQNSGSTQKNSQAAGNNSTQNQQQQNNQSLAQNNSNDKEEEEAEAEARNRRRKMNLIVEDSRDLPSEQEEEEVDDGRIQNKNIVIDLQSLFLIAAFEKNGVDYDRFQYYNIVIDDLNAKNNYDPLLSISNKPVTTYQSLFENFILFFNEKISIQENAHNYLNRGIFYSLTGDYNRALQDLNKSIELDDKASIAYFSRANSMYKMQEQIELLAGTQKNVSITMRDKNSTIDTEKENITSLDYARILEDYELTLFLNPEFFFGYYNRAYIKLRLGEYKSAVEDLNRAIELEPEFAEAYFNRGLTKIYLNDVEGGAMDLSRAGELGISGAYNIIKRYCN